MRGLLNRLRNKLPEVYFYRDTTGEMFLFPTINFTLNRVCMTGRIYAWTIGLWWGPFAWSMQWFSKRETV